MECYDCNIWKKTAKKSRKKFLSFFVVLITIICICFYYKKFVVNNLFDICQNYVKAYSTLAVNNAVLQCFGVDYGYDSIVNIEKNQNGDIVLIELNSITTNKISRDILNKTKTFIDADSKKGIPVKLGAFLGIDVFSGYGKEVSFYLSRESTVLCDFNSTFKSVGINQTIHSVYLNVIVNVNLEIPFDKRSVSFDTEVLLCEAVIVGKIPDVFLDSSIIYN